MKMKTGNVMLGVMLGVLFIMSIGHADLDDGLVAYYPLDGNAEEASGNPAASDGTENGGPYYVDSLHIHNHEDLLHLQQNQLNQAHQTQEPEFVLIHGLTLW